MRKVYKKYSKAEKKAYYLGFKNTLSKYFDSNNMDYVFKGPKSAKYRDSMTNGSYNAKKKLEELRNCKK